MVPVCGDNFLFALYYFNVIIVVVAVVIWVFGILVPVSKKCHFSDNLFLNYCFDNWNVFSLPYGTSYSTKDLYIHSVKPEIRD